MFDAVGKFVLVIRAAEKVLRQQFARFAHAVNQDLVGRFSEEAQELILAEEVPLGRILKDCHVQHRTEARAFLRVESDELMNRVFDLTPPTALYGRKAVISDLQGRPLSEIVEILPPMKA